MSNPSPDTLDREKDKLYVTDAELIRRLGVPRDIGRDVIQVLESTKNFPKKQELCGDRRYWPHVERWFNENGSKLPNGAARLITENRDDDLRARLLRRSLSAEELRRSNDDRTNTA